MSDETLDDLQRLDALKTGRHYGSSPDSDCWTMIGRDLRDVDEWTIVPPLASLTYAWGAGGCEVRHENGTITVRPGDCMWIDAGLTHRGRNLPGSDFLTVFFPDAAIERAALDTMPIGAAVMSAPPDLARAVAGLAVMLVSGALDRAAERPIVDALLDRVDAAFGAGASRDGEDRLMSRAAALLRTSPKDRAPIGDVAATLGISRSELTRRFMRRYALTPVAYRRQLRLAHATRALASGAAVAAAAQGAGFADGAHLSRTFRDQYGIAPAAWARLIRCPPKP